MVWIEEQGRDGKPAIDSPDWCSSTGIPTSMMPAAEDVLGDWILLYSHSSSHIVGVLQIFIPEQLIGTNTFLFIMYKSMSFCNVSFQGKLQILYKGIIVTKEYLFYYYLTLIFFILVVYSICFVSLHIWYA